PRAPRHALSKPERVDRRGQLLERLGPGRAHPLRVVEPPLSGDRAYGSEARRLAAANLRQGLRQPQQAAALVPGGRRRQDGLDDQGGALPRRLRDPPRSAPDRRRSRRAEPLRRRDEGLQLRFQAPPLTASGSSARLRAYESSTVWTTSAGS